MTEDVSLLIDKMPLSPPPVGVFTPDELKNLLQSAHDLEGAIAPNASHFNGEGNRYPLGISPPAGQIGNDESRSELSFLTCKQNGNWSEGGRSPAMKSRNSGLSSGSSSASVMHSDVSSEKHASDVKASGRSRFSGSTMIVIEPSDSKSAKNPLWKKVP